MLPRFLPRFPRVVVRWLCLALLLVSWGAVRLWWAWQAWLPPALEGVEQTVVLQLQDFPAARDEGWQADVEVAGLPGTVRLGFPEGPPPRFDCRYHAKVKLKRPRGLLNPGLFDYQLWLLQSGYVATGYVRQLLECEPVAPGRLVAARQAIAERLAATRMSDQARSTLLALSIGSYSDIEPGQWQLLRDSGTIHILSVSGLHIVLVAALGYWVAAGLARLLVWPLHHWPASHWGGMGSLLVAVWYALLADFSVPTQRALLMVAAAVCQRWLCSQFRWLFAWKLALVLVLLHQPLSVFGCGFWFSFLCTLVLLAAYHGVRSPVPAWRRYLVTQGLLFACMVPLSLYLYGAVPLLSLPANTVVVPLVTFVCMPLAFLGLLLMPFETASCWLLEWAGRSVDGYWWLMECLVTTAPVRLWHWGGVGLGATALATLGLLLPLLPRGVPGKWLGWVLCLPLCFPADNRLPHGAMAMTVLDVGQGLAVVVRTARHTLVYDTGERYSSRFDSGRDIVAAFLRQQRLSHVDMLVVSHSDADHAGGVAGLLASMSVRQAWSGTPERLDVPGFAPCRAGMHWRWEGVSFRVLSPGHGPGAEGTNNRSCILHIANGQHAFLLPGDAEAPIERALLGLDPAHVRADVLVAPHHGSKTSSSRAFLQAVQPGWILASAGYRNRFRHPHPSVVAAWEQQGSRWRVTAQDGALEAISTGAGLTVHTAACLRPLPWRRPSGGCGEDGL